MNEPTTERRSERADTRAGATFLLLDSLVDKAGVTALALSNDAGFLVASTRGRVDPGCLAEAGRAIVKGDLWADEAPGPLAGTDLYAHAIRVHGKTYTLVSTGARIPRLRNVTAALARILPPKSDPQG